ncbi:MAG: hypothetical protein IAG13_11600 [Deltaproteobacteria bacterium]|nr:hypothetical protein [Nannocystaceae bacterium]
MNTSIVGRIAVLGVSLGLFACKDDGIDTNQYADALPSTVCDAVVECNCEYPGGALYDHCVAQLEVSAKTLAELNGVDGLQFDGECAQKEIDAIGSLGCGVPVFDPEAKCKAPCKVWHGPMDEGGTCTSINGYDNCKQGMTCDEGVCVHPCDEADLPKVGEPCAPEFGCDENAWCDAETAPLFPVCAALPGIGQPCVESLGYACAEDLMCDTSDPGTPVCAALPGLGEECPLGACSDDLFCDVTAAPPVCSVLPALGEACPLGLCAAPNSCEDEVCVAPRASVCGYYSGVPDDGMTTIDPGTDGSLTGVDTGLETGGFDTGLDTGGFDTGLEGGSTGG